MYLLLSLLAGLALATRAYVRALPRAIAFRRRLAPDRLFPGEPLELVIEVENRSRLPIPWLVTHDRVPEGCAADGAPRARLSRGWPGLPGRITEAWRLLGRERRRRRLRLTAPARGVHRVGPGDAWWTDPLGLREGMAELPGEVPFVVYPRLFPLGERDLPGERPLGSRPRAGWLHADPLQVAGVRPYQAGDPYRQVHWASSARTGSLQVRRTVPAFEPAAALFVGVRTGPSPWGGDRARAEAALSVAAALAAWRELRTAWVRGGSGAGERRRRPPGARRRGPSPGPPPG